MRFILLIIISLFLQIAMADTVYTWQDADGKVHFSQTPNDPSAKAVTFEDKAPNSPALDARRTANQERRQQAEVEKSRAKMDEEIRKEQEEFEAQRTKACAKYQENLKLLQETGRRVYRVTPEGEYHYFSDEERKAEIQRIEQDITRHCSE